jgi:hypothetical protein
MKFSIGIIGLPNVGKSTFFQFLTKLQVNIANYPFTTINPNVGVVAVPDERLEKIAQIFHSQKILPYPLEFIDIAGLVKGAHQGQGLGNQFLAQVRECDALLHLIRVFQNPEVAHLEGEIDPLRDFEIVQNELQLKDSESKEEINLLAKKPQLLLINGKGEEVPENFLEYLKSKNLPYLIIDLFLTGGSTSQTLKSICQEIEPPKIADCFIKLLNLVTFFTANENEARSWLIKQGTEIKKAAGLVHTDFEQKFIRAEVIQWDKLVAAGGWHQAKVKGLLRLEGREYLVQDGDVIYFKI